MSRRISGTLAARRALAGLAFAALLGACAGAGRRFSPPAAASNGLVEWVAIPGGSFLMGSEAGLPDELPVHRVTVGAFLMARTEVTNRQYRACVDAGACAAPAAYEGGDEHPVGGVSWEQAGEFSAWVGGRLPSEAEWEYAARSAGKPWKYPWGDEVASCARAVIKERDGSGEVKGRREGCGREASWPVCALPEGNTEQGLCDMAGNVWEWVEDWYHRSYRGAPSDATAWISPRSSERVNRGGAFAYDASHARSARRYRDPPRYRVRDLGFRPAR